MFYFRFSCIFLLFVIFPVLTQAANHTVMPLALNLDVAKRDIITEQITLRNDSSRQVRLYASVHEVATDREGVLEAFVSPAMVDRTTSPTSWIEVTRTRIEIAPGASEQIPVTIRMNPNTEPGRYSVFVGFAEASNQPQATQKVMQGDAPGTLINISVDETQNQFLRLARFVIDRFITGENGGTITYQLANPSSVDVVPAGEIIFYDTRGQEVESMSLNLDKRAIAPAATETFTTTVPEDLPWGKYKAFMTVEYGNNMQASLNDTAFFYVFPLWQLVTVFVVVLLLALLLTVYLHHRNYGYQDEDDSLPLYVYDGESHPHEHDINLKS